METIWNSVSLGLGSREFIAMSLNVAAPPGCGSHSYHSGILRSESPVHLPGLPSCTALITALQGQPGVWPCAPGETPV